MGKRKGIRAGSTKELVSRESNVRGNVNGITTMKRLESTTEPSSSQDDVFEVGWDSPKLLHDRPCQVSTAAEILAHLKSNTSVTHTITSQPPRTSPSITLKYTSPYHEPGLQTTPPRCPTFRSRVGKPHSKQNEESQQEILQRVRAVLIQCQNETSSAKSTSSSSPKCANETSTASLASESEVFAVVAPSFVVKDATPVCSFGGSSTVSKILSSDSATPRRISVPFNNDSINVTPCRGQANRSAYDDLWTDEESFNDTFIKATQKIMDEYEHEYTSPESKKRKEFVSSTPEVPFKGSGRFTFTLDSVKPITTHKPFSLKSADSSAASSCQAVKVIGNDVAKSAAILDTSLPDELFAAILDTDQSIRAGDAVKNSKQSHTMPGKNCTKSNDPKFSAPAPILKQGNTALPSDESFEDALFNEPDVLALLEKLESQVLPSDSKSSGSMPSDSKSSGSMPLNSKSSGSMPLNSKSSGSMPLNSKSSGSMPLNSKSSGSMPLNSKSSGSMPLNSKSSVSMLMDSESSGSMPLVSKSSGSLLCQKLPATTNAKSSGSNILNCSVSSNAKSYGTMPDNTMTSGSMSSSKSSSIIVPVSSKSSSIIVPVSSKTSSIVPVISKSTSIIVPVSSKSTSNIVPVSSKSSIIVPVSSKSSSIIVPVGSKSSSIIVPVGSKITSSTLSRWNTSPKFTSATVSAVNCKQSNSSCDTSFPTDVKCMSTQFTTSAAKSVVPFTKANSFAGLTNFETRQAQATSSNVSSASKAVCAQPSTKDSKLVGPANQIISQSSLAISMNSSLPVVVSSSHQHPRSVSSLAVLRGNASGSDTPRKNRLSTKCLSSDSITVGTFDSSGDGTSPLGVATRVTRLSSSQQRYSAEEIERKKKEAIQKRALKSLH